MPTLERCSPARIRWSAVVSQPDRPRGRGRHDGALARLGAGAARGRPAAAARARRRSGGGGRAAPRSRPTSAWWWRSGSSCRKRDPRAPAPRLLINAHASLLPKLPRRRADPARDPGRRRRAPAISVMRVEREMDAGPVALVRELEIGPEETAGELDGAARGGAAPRRVAEAVEQIAQGRVRWTPQPEQGVTLAPKLVGGRRGARLPRGRGGAGRAACARSPPARARRPGSTASGSASWRRARSPGPSTRSPARVRRGARSAAAHRDRRRLAGAAGGAARRRTRARDRRVPARTPASRRRKTRARG